MMNNEEKLCFLVCWEDRNSGLVRDFHLYFYSQEKCFEMFDLKTKKTFLKKTKYENIKQGEVLAFNNEFLKISSPLFQRIFISAIPLFFTQEHSKLWIMETISQERVVQHGLKVHSFS